jgi:hypothetical protein
MKLNCLMIVMYRLTIELKKFRTNFIFQKYGYGGWVHMDHSASTCSSGPREANMMKDGNFFRKVKVSLTKLFFVSKNEYRAIL